MFGASGQREGTIGKLMRRAVLRVLGLVVLALPSCNSLAKADTGDVQVLFTKGGVILGVGRGHGVLYLRGHRYPFQVSGLSVGFTFGASTARLSGTAMNLVHPSDIQGTYRLLGAGAALAAGGGSVQLQNERGVVLQLSGAKVGVEVSVALGGVTVAFK
jgi:hypothetical protein